MSTALSFDAALHFLTAGMALAFCLTTLPFGRKASDTGSAYRLGGFSAVLSLWSAAAGIATASIEPEARFLWTQISFLLAQTTILVLFLFSLSFAQARRRPPAPLSSIPAAAILLVLAANPLHRLFWKGYESGAALSGGILPMRGPLFFGLILYGIAYSAASALLILAAAIRSRGPFRIQRFCVFAALCLAWLASFVSMPGLFPPIRVDLGPWGFLVLDAILVALFLRGGFLEARREPLARDWVIDQIRDPFIVLDSRNAILDANRAARGLLGIGAQAIGKRASLAEPWRSALEDQAPGQRPRVVTVEDGAGGKSRKRWYELIRQEIGLGPGRDGARVILIHDVTDIASQGLDLRATIGKLDRRYGRAKASEKEQRELAVRDGLTSLFNRRYLEEILPEIVADARLASRKLSLAMIDMDHFKAVNDNFGHDAGDMVLKRFADYISGVIRSTDVAARFGGEEFVIVFPQLGGEAALRKIESLLAAFRDKPFRAGNKGFRMTFSAGIAELRPDMDDAESLVKRADEAMYRAKGSGRNKAVLAGQK